MCHTILHGDNDHKTCLEVAFTFHLEVSGVLFVLRIFGWLIWGFFLFGFFFWSGVEAGLFFFNGGYFNDFASVSNIALQTVKSVMLRDGTGLVRVAGRELSKAGGAFPK